MLEIKDISKSFGGVMAAAAGMLYGIDVQLNPYMGWNFLILLFAATILGTIGNMYGALGRRTCHRGGPAGLHGFPDADL